MSIQHDLQYVTELGARAARVALDHYGKVERLTKTHAATTDEAVTDADRAAQRYVVAGCGSGLARTGSWGRSRTRVAITAEIPDAGGRVWVIDPIDGTNNFIAGWGRSRSASGCWRRGGRWLGVVYDVTRDEMYWRRAGRGAWRGTRRSGRRRRR
jgi:myo-inositol-1(or 4)-monophosphatase